MEGLIARLLALTGGLAAAAGTSAGALADLRRLIAAILIQADPGLAPVPDAGADPDIAAAAAEGVALAAERNAAGVRSRVLREPYLASLPGPERTAATFGPFVDAGDQLVVFRIVDVAAFLPVEMHIQLPFVDVEETPLLLPADAAADDALRSFVLPAGTVWIRGERLVQGAPGYAVLRIAGGSLELDAAATQAAPGAPLQITLDTAWTLTVIPEPPPAAGAGSDGDGLAVTLPGQLVVRSDGQVVVDGAPGLVGFGGDLRFETPQGAPVLTDAAIAFAYAGPPDPWMIDGGRSSVATFSGKAAVQLGLWALPLTDVVVADAFEAAHGGTVAAQFQGSLSCALGGAAGRILWADPNLTANALGFELKARNADAAAALDLSLWGPAQTRLDLSGPVRSLRFASLRGGADVASLSGGRLRNRWDLPRAASGAPLAFEGSLTALGLIAEAGGGLRRLVAAAVQPAATEVQGLALQNLYLQVRGARALSIAASGPDSTHLTAGQGRLIFDVEAGEPMLPDPYAASWATPAEPRVVEAGLTIGLGWSVGGDPPRVQATLAPNISFPEPRDDIPESDLRLGERFRAHLQAQPEFLALLDLSSGDDHLGVALESLSAARPQLDADNRLAVELRDVRLLMQPQVHWEPLEDVTPAGVHTRMTSPSHGGRTLVGANSVKLVPVLPGRVGGEIVSAVGRGPTAALFSLPFGLRAFVAMSSPRDRPPQPPAVSVSLHAPRFDPGLTSAQQLRLEAPRRPPPFRGLDSARTMPGALHQTENPAGPPGLRSVLSDLVAGFNADFDGKVPLHAVDLSGYGLSTFSNWHVDTDDALGVTQVRFDVMNGRTAYEVIQVRSVLALCQALVVRTVIMERRNSGRVERFDSGWVAQDDGLYNHFVPFETGAVRALRRIRNIRILPDAPLNVQGGSTWQAVRFDCDAEIDGLAPGGAAALTPALNQLGYVQMTPSTPPDLPRFRALCAAAGGPIGGPLDCNVRLGETLDMRLSSLAGDFAPDDGGGPGFSVAVYGAPAMPRAGQWSTVRIDGATSDVSTVDPRHGVPVVRRPGQPYTFREPSDGRKTAGARSEFGFLFATPSSRVLFPKPSIDPGQPGQLTGAPPLMADPVSLLQASSVFPRAAFALRGKGLPRFAISAANDWRLETPDISFDAPAPGVAGAADWSLNRAFGALPDFNLKIDSLDVAQPWDVGEPPHDLRLVIDAFGADPLLTLKSAFAAAADRATAGLQQPTVVFGPVLDEVQELVNALQGFIDLPFEVHVDVAAGTGPSPSFIVRLNIKLRVGEGPDERIDIGVGKFYGEFVLEGELEAALSGDSHGRVALSFDGDIQQGILPPLLYAGGRFHFMIEVRDDAEPVIELGLGTAVSVGGDLIKGLLEVEVTITYGYTLIPATLQPGVLLGLEARAKLLAGLVGFSFSADAMARIQRLNSDDKTVRIFADIRVAASIQVAIFFKKRVDFRTQFEQNLPLAPLLIVAGANPIGAVAASALI